MMVPRCGSTGFAGEYVCHLLGQLNEVAIAKRISDEYEMPSNQQRLK